MSAISGLHHVALRVSDLDRSLALYRDTLGLAVKVTFALDGRRFALLEAGNSGYIELVETRTPVHLSRPDDVMWHFAIRTANIGRALEAVANAGYEVTMPTTALDLTDTVSGQPFAIRIAFFRGPDGEEVELLEDEAGLT